MKALSNLAKFFARHPLTSDQQLRAWGRFVAWQVRSRLADEIEFDWIGGLKLVVRRGMTGATGNIYTGLHEFADMAFPIHYLRKEDLFLDIGANVGSYTVLAAGLAGAKTWSFEPDPNTFEHLKRNVAVNGLEDRATLFNLALGPQEGEVPFTIGLDCINQVASEAGENTRMVIQKKLDDLAADAAPEMLKLDVEGYEAMVVAGAAKTLAHPGLNVIELETVDQAIIDQLSANGFKRYYYNPFERLLADSEFDFSSSNALYVRDIDKARERVRTAAAVTVNGRSI